MSRKAAIVAAAFLYGSTNGTLYEGARLERATVRPGSVLVLGHTSLRVTDGERITLPLPDGAQTVRVRGIWRDYARQFGAVAIEPTAWRAHGGDDRINELALWLAPGADAPSVVEQLRAQAGADVPLDASLLLGSFSMLILPWWRPWAARRLTLR